MEKTTAQPQVTTLGEALVVFDPLSRGRLRHVQTFAKRIGGAELNVAVALCRLGHRAGWAGAVGDDEFGREILSLLRGEYVDVTHAHLDPDAPTGIYFKERRALDKLRAYYYRAGSAASLHHQLDDAEMDYLLSTHILHLTGITPALSAGCRDSIEHLLAAAREREVLVSFDANIRWRLFKNQDPKNILAPLLARADIVFLSDEEADLFLGANDADSARRFLDNTRVSVIVVHDADGAFAVDHNGVTHKAGYSVGVVDTVGAGDAFVAGFLAGRLRGQQLGECLDMANACGACAVTIPGDAASMPAEEEVLSLIHNRSGIER